MATFLGLTVSLAANVAHSFVPPKDAPEDWSPHVGAVLLALVWPIAVYVVIEVFARALRRDLTWWTVVRYVALAPVALVAAVVSYSHLSALMLFYGESEFVSTIGPLGIDGLMIMGTGALIAVSRPRVVRDDEPSPINLSQNVELSAEELESLEKAFREAESKAFTILPATLARVIEPDSIAEVVTEQLPHLATTHRAPARAAAEHAEIVKSAIPDWGQREIKGPEIAMITGIKGAESIQKIKDVLYPNSPTALRRAAKRQEREHVHSA